MGRFLPLFIPSVVVALLAIVNFRFWRVGTVGREMSALPPIQLGGETVVLLRPIGIGFSHPDFRWRVDVAVESLVRLGELEMGYGRGREEPLPEAWERVPTGTAFGAFRVAPKVPEGASEFELVPWVRARKLQALPPVRAGSG